MSHPPPKPGHQCPYCQGRSTAEDRVKALCEAAARNVRESQAMATYRVLFKHQAHRKPG